MGRLVVLLLAVFAAPILAWFLWLWIRRCGEAQANVAAQRWQDAPWAWLLSVGLVLAVAVVLAFGVLEDRDCMPVPAQVIDGKLVPARCK